MAADVSLSPASIQERVSEGVLTALESGDWTTSPYAYDLMEQNARTLLHKSYAVGLGTTEPAALDRQRRSDGILCTTEVLVKHAQRIRGDAQVADYQAALTEEASLIGAVLRVAGIPELRLLFRGVRGRRVVGDGTVYIGDLAFEVLHTLDF
jgi:hypothetical protein